MTKVTITPNNKSNFGSLSKGDYFSHNGTFYIKTNISLVEASDFNSNGKFIKFNCVRLTGRQGSRGQFQDITPVKYIEALNLIAL